MFKKIITILIVLFAAGNILCAESKAKIIDIDTGKSGTYTSGKWKYVFTITNEGSKSQGCLGELYYKGKRVIPKSFLDLRKTPWGNIVWVGNPPLLWEPKGWLVRKASPAKKPVPKRIDYTKSDTYISGKWKYVFTITAPGDKSEKRMGRLYYDGKELLPLSIKMLCRKTPWGEICQGGAGALMSGESEGWLTKKELESIEMPPPIETLNFEQNPLSKWKKAKSKRVKTIPSNPYFSALLPDGWKQKVIRGANSKVFLVELLKKTDSKIPVSIYLIFYPNNSDFSNYKDFIEANSKNIFGETSTPREKYGPVKKITINGMKGFYLTKAYQHYLHLNKKSNESVNTKKINIVIPATNGFYVLNYRSAESDTKKYFSVFKKVVKSFKALQGLPN